MSWTGEPPLNRLENRQDILIRIKVEALMETVMQTIDFNYHIVSSGGRLLISNNINNGVHYSWSYWLTIWFS